jgi:hypothetical protein
MTSSVVLLADADVVMVLAVDFIFTTDEWTENASTSFSRLAIATSRRKTKSLLTVHIVYILNIFFAED